MKINRVTSWCINVAAFVLSLVSCFYLLSSVHRWAWPRYWGPSVNVMSATGYSLGGPLWRSLAIAVPLAFLPRFRQVPGRYMLAAAILLVIFSGFEAYLVYSRTEAGNSPYALQASHAQ
jgi:hypothetical protein